MQIVAFGHKSRQGKDQCVKFLDSYLRLAGVRSRRVSFAAKLKETCYQLFQWAGLKPGIFYEDEEGAKERYIKLPAVDLSPVEIWIAVGNKMRDVYEPIWIANALQSNQNVDVLLVPDLRFPNEAAKIKELGGLCIKVVRPGFDGLNSPSDNALNSYTDWDEIVHNSSDLSMLNSTMEVLSFSIIERYKNGKSKSN